MKTFDFFLGSTIFFGGTFCKRISTTLHLARTHLCSQLKTKNKMNKVLTTNDITGQFLIPFGGKTAPSIPETGAAIDATAPKFHPYFATSLQVMF